MFKFKLKWIFTLTNQIISIQSQTWLSGFSLSCDHSDSIFYLIIFTLVAKIVIVHAHVHNLVQVHVHSFLHCLQEYFIIIFIFMFMQICTFIFMFTFKFIITEANFTVSMQFQCGLMLWFWFNSSLISTLVARINHIVVQFRFRISCNSTSVSSSHTYSLTATRSLWDSQGVLESQSPGVPESRSPGVPEPWIVTLPQNLLHKLREMHDMLE